MPSRNIIKQYAKNGYYHIYNRGVERRQIFGDKKDCIMFQRFLKQYLSPKDRLEMFLTPKDRIDRIAKVNMSGQIEILAFALMPNHFHLLLRQTEEYSIATFMQRLFTSYVLYFNKKYKRIGPLFQDTYKAVLVQDDSYLLHLSSYIHLNSKNLSGRNDIDYSEFCSYPYYLGEKEGMWIHPEFVLDYFSGSVDRKRTAYKNFVEKIETTGSLIISPKTRSEILLDL